MSDNPDPPHQPRIKVNQSATLRDGDGQAVPCTIVDVSHEGFRLSTPGALPRGSRFTLDFDNESHPVEIRWVAAGEAGGLFLDAPPRN